jgi:hypothetical protein
VLLLTSLSVFWLQDEGRRWRLAGCLGHCRRADGARRLQSKVCEATIELYLAQRAPHALYTPADDRSAADGFCIGFGFE